MKKLLPILLCLLLLTGCGDKTTQIEDFVEETGDSIQITYKGSNKLIMTDDGSIKVAKSNGDTVLNLDSHYIGYKDQYITGTCVDASTNSFYYIYTGEACKNDKQFEKEVAALSFTFISSNPTSLIYELEDTQKEEETVGEPEEQGVEETQEPVQEAEPEPVPENPSHSITVNYGARDVVVDLYGLEGYSAAVNDDNHVIVTDNDSKTVADISIIKLPELIWYEFAGVDHLGYTVLKHSDGVVVHIPDNDDIVLYITELGVDTKAFSAHTDVVPVLYAGDQAIRMYLKNDTATIDLTDGVITVTNEDGTMFTAKVDDGTYKNVKKIENGGEGSLKDYEGRYYTWYVYTPEGQDKEYIRAMFETESGEKVFLESEQTENYMQVKVFPKVVFKDVA